MRQDEADYLLRAIAIALSNKGYTIHSWYEPFASWLQGYEHYMKEYFPHEQAYIPLCPKRDQK